MSRSSANAEAGGHLWGFMYALGLEGPPADVSLEGCAYRLERVVKHDFWAATCFYADPLAGERVVVKFGRINRLCVLPMRWAGHILVSRESRFYRRLGDVAAVPRWLGKLPHPWIGFVHEYAEGVPISEADAGRLGEDFFAALGGVLEQLHDRGIAYVDLHKEQNVIIDPAGRPHLIDFQISYDLEAGFLRWVLPRAVRKWLFSLGVRADQYHLVKHKKFLRPDLLSAEERQRVERRVWFIRLHALLVAPYRFLRRRLLRRWRLRGRLLPEGAR